MKWLYANDDYLKLPYQDNLSSLIHSRSFLELVDFEMPNLLKYIVKLGNNSVHTNDDYLKLPYQDNLSSLIHSRSFLELVDFEMPNLLKYIVKLGNNSVHTNTMITREEAILNLSSLIHSRSFLELVDFEMPNLLKYIVKLGNNSVHTNTMITREEAILSLHNLHQFVSWIDYCYSDEYTASDFDEKLIDKEENKRTNPEVLKKIYEEQASKDKKLEQMIKENEELRKQLTEINRKKRVKKRGLQFQYR